MAPFVLLLQPLMLSSPSSSSQSAFSQWSPPRRPCLLRKRTLQWRASSEKGTKLITFVGKGGSGKTVSAILAAQVTNVFAILAAAALVTIVSLLPLIAIVARTIVSCKDSRVSMMKRGMRMWNCYEMFFTWNAIQTRRIAGDWGAEFCTGLWQQAGVSGKP